MHGTIDIETLDTKPSALILSIGAVKFDPSSSIDPHSELYLKINFDEQINLNRTISDATLNWWSKQGSDVQDEAFDQSNALPIEEALKALSKWSIDIDVFWGQGYGFDFTILDDLYKSKKMSSPWNFWQIRDSRTLFSMLEFYKANPKQRLGIQDNKHNALKDAYYQSKGIQLAYQEFKLRA